ncbi:MAG: hypothetical protein STSR0004_12800 [Peptococcaceae bacterium]
MLNLSDRILPEACRFDIRYKYILDLELNDMGFDHSVFGKFRDRLLTSSIHKEALFELVKMVTGAGLIKQNESQRTDSFHIIANVVVPAASELIREGIRICLRHLKRRHYDLFCQAQEKLDTAKYLKGELAKGLKPEPDEILKTAAVNRDSRRRQSTGRFSGSGPSSFGDVPEKCVGSSALRKHGTH